MKFYSSVCASTELLENEMCECSCRKACCQVWSKLSALTTDSASKLQVLGKDGCRLRMNCTKVGVFKQPDQVTLCCLLDRLNGRRLKTKIHLEILGDLTQKTTERQLAQKKLSRLLIAADLAQSHRARAIAVRLFDRKRTSLHGCLVRQNYRRRLSTDVQVLARSLYDDTSVAVSALAQGSRHTDLLRACHFVPGETSPNTTPSSLNNNL